MKKVFTLKDEKLHIDRVVDGIKRDVKKYIKRERNKALPEGFGFWQFDCFVGSNEDKKVSVIASALSKTIDEVVKEGKDTCYIEITSRAVEKKVTIKEEGSSEELS